MVGADTIGTPRVFYAARVPVIHLDTSFLIRGFVPGSAEDRRLRNWLKSGEPLGMSVIAWAELLCGPMEPGHMDLASQVISERIPLVEEDALLTSRLFNEAGRRRGSLLDCMIAATALRAEAPLATANASDFRRFAALGLTLVES